MHRKTRCKAHELIYNVLKVGGGAGINAEGHHVPGGRREVLA
jgi:hypothetical protein